MRYTIVICVSAVVVALANEGDAVAAPRRIAIVVGANGAPDTRRALRFAHFDAQGMAQVLEEVGDLAPEDVHVLLDPEPAQLLQELESAFSQLGAAAGGALIFYYSGHADEQALYPGGKALALAQLRALLDDPRADLKVIVVDACRGGGWTGAKGLTKAEPFDVDLSRLGTSEGSAFIASSSGHEEAHESEQLRGSFFTHYWIAALRGSGDGDSDGVVTLGEAFDYAKAMTVRDTALYTRLPQHPSFNLNLRGRGDIVLTTPSRSKSSLVLVQHEGPLAVVDLATGVVRFETTRGARRFQLAVDSGRHLVLARRGEHNLAAEVDVLFGKAATVDEKDLTPVSREEFAQKGLDLTLDTSMEETTRLARAELAIGQTLSGIALGVELCLLGDCRDPGALAFLMFATGGAGLAGALLSTKDGIRPGEALAVNSGAAWGYWQGLGLALAFNVERPERSIAVGHLAGTAAGVLAASHLHPHAGTVSLGNSLGIWSGTLALLSATAWAPGDLNGQDLASLLLVSSDVGLLAGLTVGSQAELSRGRVLVIDAGGILGGLLGMGVITLIYDDKTTERQLAGSAAIGAALGLGTAAWSTRSWDAPDTTASLVVLPTPGGALANLSVEF